MTEAHTAHSLDSSPTTVPEGADPGAGLRLPACAALVGVAAGLGLQQASLFRLGARLGLGTPLDDAVFGVTALALVGIGALLFASIARTALGRSLTGPAAAAVAAGNLAVVAAVTTPLGFASHCARFGTDPSLAGTPYVSVTAALVLFVAPALATGAFLVSQPHAKAWILALGGMLLGWLAWPLAMERVQGSANVVLLGAGVAGAGTALMGLTGALRTKRRLTLGSGLALAACAAWLNVSPVVVYPPWQRFRVVPEEIYETVGGQITLLPAGGEVRQVLVDQRPLTPGSEGLALEAACLARTMEIWSETRGDSGTSEAPRTLVVGLVTPERAALLEAAGIADWTSGLAPDHPAAHLDAESPGALSSGVQSSGVQSAGVQSAGALSPDVNSTRTKFTYDLALTFPTGAYLAAGWDLDRLRRAPAQLKIAWLPQDAPPGVEWPGGRLVFAADGLVNIGFGIVENAPRDCSTHPLRSYPAPASWVPPGGASLAWLRTRPDARPLRTLESVCRDLGADAPAGLLTHAAAQRIGSPFDAPLERVVLVPEALASLRDSALERAAAKTRFDAFERALVEGAAEALMAQDEVAWLQEFIAPVAKEFPGWDELQRAVAWAEVEALEFAAAVNRLRPLRALDPENRGLTRQLADALVAAEDPEGRALAQALLRDAPEDPELFGLAQGLRGMRTVRPLGGGYESLTQAEALDLATGAFLGTVSARTVREVDVGDGAPLFLTTLTVRGTALAKSDGSAQEHRVTFLGGFLGGLPEEERGSFNSTAPPAHRTRVGRQIFYYYKTLDDIAGDVPGDVLLRGRAGLFTAFESPAGDLIVQGRGNNAAIPYNLRRDELPWPRR